MEPEEFIESLTGEDAELIDYENKVLILWVDYSKYEGVNENVELQELCEDISSTLGVSVLALPDKIEKIESAGLERLNEKLGKLKDNIEDQL